MMQEIVINVPMHRQKDKSKAMKIAAGIQGVISVSIGEENDQLEVIGEGVDSVCLAKSLRKKFCYADIISVQETTPPETPNPSPPPSPSENPDPGLPQSPQYWHFNYPPPYCPPVYFECRVYDAGPPNCSIM